MKTNKEIYQLWSQQTPLPLYLHSEWLDAVCRDGLQWDVLFSYNSQQQIQGFWVIVFKRQLFWNKITMPAFTPYLGPRIIYPEKLSEYGRISFENKVLEELIHQLPPCSDIRFKWSLDYTNGLPFYWNQFQQKTAYTYLIKDTSDIDGIYNDFKSSIQRQIKKASAQLQVRTSEHPEGVINMFKKSMGAKSASLVQTEILKKIHIVAQQKQQFKILEAYNNQEKILAAIYLIKDHQEVVYLYGGYDDDYNDSGAMSLLFWEAIQWAHHQQLAFNFEGSMIKGVERFFRSFGGTLTPVFTISKSKFPYNFLSLLR